ncbi:MAG: hypothetical protein M5U28_12535 [Sandaracinaceae bacterium]|nr:hypothetical protein [Sandaracinaceae bacterium]
MLDAGRDAGRDAGPRDAGRDGGTFTPCSSDRDCASDVCRARPGFAPSDQAPILLACAPADVDRAPVTAPCASRSDCDRGLCALPGACLMPCASDTDCAPTSAAARRGCTAAVAMQPVRACVALVAAPSSSARGRPRAGPGAAPLPRRDRRRPAAGSAADDARGVDGRRGDAALHPGDPHAPGGRARLRRVRRRSGRARSGLGRRRHHGVGRRHAALAERTGHAALGRGLHGEPRVERRRSERALRPLARRRGPHHRSRRPPRRRRRLAQRRRPRPARAGARARRRATSSRRPG